MEILVLDRGIWKSALLLEFSNELKIRAQIKESGQCAQFNCGEWGFPW